MEEDDEAGRMAVDADGDGDRHGELDLAGLGWTCLTGLARLDWDGLRWLGRLAGSVVGG